MSAALPMSMRVMPEHLPARIGAYPVRGVIGTGSMGVVYLGHDPGIDRPVAIKTIRRHLLDASAELQSAAQRFRIEAQAAGRLNHRNIVSVYQFGEDEDCAYIVMEYIAGQSVSEYLRRPGRLTLPEVLGLVFQLLDALHYAHECGVVHRDIKPANLMIDRDGRLKVTDFGIARTESSQVTRANMLVGSPGYMAPEQYTGGTLDRRVDVFAAGVLLFQLLTGSIPFTGTDDAMMYRIVYEPHDSLVKRTGNPAFASYDAILDRALAKVPAERYASAQEFLYALKAVAGDGVAARLANERLLPPSPAAFIPLPSHAMPTPTSPPVAPPVAPADSGTRPASVPVPTGWDEQQLADLEHELALHVGPMAMLLVRRAARGQTDIAVVRQLAAAAIVGAEPRERFLAGTRGGGAKATVATRPPSSASGLASSHPSRPHEGRRLSAEDIGQAETALARSLGPIAKLLVQRCAEDGITREQFVARLLKQLAARVDIRHLETTLWRSLD
jgi:eukaryotic-like serine/threonine-protein kinase